VSVANWVAGKRWSAWSIHLIPLLSAYYSSSRFTRTLERVDLINSRYSGLLHGGRSNFSLRMRYLNGSPDTLAALLVLPA
jgi:hypothetical protein